MEQETFLEHYRICRSEAGREVSRTGAAINYKAIDTRTHESVRLQLIPLATIEPEKLAQLKERAETAEKLDHVNIAKTLAVGIDHDYFVLVSEYFDGETADAWVVENGPMAADAALRAGLQIVRALGAAAYFNLTHRAIQPANLMIVPGQSADGGWPFVKLLNFGLAGLELHSESTEAREIAPTISPQFASPEQRAGREIDFRSEMYSLGATICFLLTGAAPLAVSGMKARLRIQRLPELRRAPKPLHELLVYLLRENPDNRPQDPVALEKQMRECLTKIEKRQAIGRKLGIPLAAVVPRKTRQEKQPAGPLKQVFAGFAAVVVLLLAGAAAAEYFFADKIPFLRHDGQVGVPIGVPDAAKFATNSAAPQAPNAAANPPPQNPSPEVERSPAVAQSSDSSTSLDKNSIASSAQDSTQVGAAQKASEPAAPALAPSEPPSSSTITQNSDESSSVERDQPTVRTKKKSVVSTRRSPPYASSRSARLPGSEQDNVDRSYPSRRHVAHVVGRTGDGRLIVRLSSGRVVVLPRATEDNIYVPRPRHRAYVEEQDDNFVPPEQPFYPND